MEPTPHLKQSMSASRISSVDVSQLDKINAIPNKTTNNVLLDGLCQEDQLYLDAIMDEESSDSENNADERPGGSPWSPAMAERPMVVARNKRFKRMRPSYAITMSLEDISYIRPSWGMSKGVVKRIEAKRGVGRKRGKRRAGASSKDAKATGTTSDTHKEDEEQELGEQRVKSLIFNTYNMSLAGLMLLLSFLMLLSYYIDLARQRERTFKLRLELEPQERIFNILKFRDGQLMADGHQLRVHYGRGIARNLKHEECTCRMYHTETMKYFRSHMPLRNPGNNTAYWPISNDSNSDGLDDEKCFACFDWAMRANLQVLVNRSRLSLAPNDNGPDGEQADDRTQPGGANPAPQTPQTMVPLDEDLSITCYDVRWQSYDSLRTPLVDCIHLNEGDQWFGLGDIQSPLVWPVNKYNHRSDDRTPLASNLSSEYGPYTPENPAHASHVSIASSPKNNNLNPLPEDPSGEEPREQTLVMGSHAQLQLISSSGFYVGNLRSDFQGSVQISAKRHEICLSVSCTDRCTSTWSRLDHLTGKFRFHNNLFEYSICSASSWKALVSRLINERQRATRRSSELHGRSAQRNWSAPVVPSASAKSLHSSQRLGAIERLEMPMGADLPSAPLRAGDQHVSAPTQVSSAQVAPAPEGKRQQMDGIGLVERTLFVTSREYNPELNGQTLRQHVDKIVKLNLKTSPILVLDTRWQTYSGSFKINLAYFPKAKLLFEILHNKGFKVVLTVKPYIDTSIGMANLNQLLDSQRLVRANYRNLATTELMLDSIDSSSLNDGQNLTASMNMHRERVVRRESFFGFREQTVSWFNRNPVPTSSRPSQRTPPFMFNCGESHDGHCALVDLSLAQNRLWFIDTIKRSSFLTQEADGIMLAGAHPDCVEWENQYRESMAELVDRIFYHENLYVIPRWTGNFNYLQLAPRSRTWDDLRSLVDSVLTLGMLGFSLVNPGSVWGDLKPSDVQGASIAGGPGAGRPNEDSNGGGGGGDEEDFAQRERRAEEELIVRWLQVAMFLPVLQFNDLAPIEKHNLQEQLQQLVRVRKLFVVPEIKRHLPYTPLVNNSARHQPGAWPAAPYQLPALRYTWATTSILSSGQQNHQNQNQNHNHHRRQLLEPQAEAVGQQFMIGPDLLVAPVLQAGQRQKDIYLPLGIWHDELRQTNVRGGKWLRNYHIELSEVAWFTRARRRRKRNAPASL